MPTPPLPKKYSVKIKYPSKRKNTRLPLNKKRSTIKSSNSKILYSPQQTSKIVKKFMEMLNCIKLFHWQTKSYSQHKASDELYENLNENIDKFIETLLGKDQSKIKKMERRLDLYDECVNGTDTIKNRIFEFCNYLEDITYMFDARRDSDLLNIRDEILGDLNRFLYLLELM